MDVCPAHEEAMGQDGEREDGVKSTAEVKQGGAAEHEPVAGGVHGSEGQAPATLREVGQPTKIDRREHEHTHIPFRAWCAECVRGRGKDRYHRRIAYEDGVARVGIDYMFLTEHGVYLKHKEAVDGVSGDESKVLTVLVLKDFRFKSVWAYPVPAKGTLMVDWVADHIVADLETCGLNTCHLVVKNDQEPAIVDVQSEVMRRRGIAGADGTAKEHSRVGDSSSNGRVERCIQEVGGMTRTYRSALEQKIGRPIPVSHPMSPGW